MGYAVRREGTKNELWGEKEGRKKLEMSKLGRKLWVTDSAGTSTSSFHCTRVPQHITVNGSIVSVGTSSFFKSLKSFIYSDRQQQHRSQRCMDSPSTFFSSSFCHSWPSAKCSIREKQQRGISGCCQTSGTPAKSFRHIGDPLLQNIRWSSDNIPHRLYSQ